MSVESIGVSAASGGRCRPPAREDRLHSSRALRFDDLPKRLCARWRKARPGAGPDVSTVPEPAEKMRAAPRPAIDELGGVIAERPSRTSPAAAARGRPAASTRPSPIDSVRKARWDIPCCPRTRQSGASPRGNRQVPRTGENARALPGCGPRSDARGSTSDNPSGDPWHRRSANGYPRPRTLAVP